MRLIKFINESSYKEVTDTEEEIIKILRRDCKKYLNLIRGLMPFKRGIEELPAPTQYEDFAMYSKNTRKIRKPKGGMFDNLYNVVNEWLIENNIYGRRSLSFDQFIEMIENKWKWVEKYMSFDYVKEKGLYRGFVG